MMMLGTSLPLRNSFEDVRSNRSFSYAGFELEPRLHVPSFTQWAWTNVVRRTGPCGLLFTACVCDFVQGAENVFETLRRSYLFQCTGEGGQCRCNFEIPTLPSQCSFEDDICPNDG